MTTRPEQHTTAREAWPSLTLAATLLGVVAGCGGHPWVVVQQAQPNPFVGKSRFYAHEVSFEGLRIGSKSEAEYVSGKEDDSAASFEADKEAVAERYHENLVQAARGYGVKVKRPKAKRVAGLSARELLLGRVLDGGASEGRSRPPTFLLVADEAAAPPPVETAEEAPAERKVAPSADEEFDEGESEGVAEGPFVIKPTIDFMEPGFYAFVAKAPSTITVNVQIEDSAGQLLDEIEITQSWGASAIDAASGTRYRKIAAVLGRITAEYLEHRTAPPEE